MVDGGGWCVNTSGSGLVCRLVVACRSVGSVVWRRRGRRPCLSAEASPPVGTGMYSGRMRRAYLSVEASRQVGGAVHPGRLRRRRTGRRTRELAFRGGRDELIRPPALCFFGVRWERGRLWHGIVICNSMPLRFVDKHRSAEHCSARIDAVCRLAEQCSALRWSLENCFVNQPERHGMIFPIRSSAFRRSVAVIRPNRPAKARDGTPNKNALA